MNAVAAIVIARHAAANQTQYAVSACRVDGGGRERQALSATLEKGKDRAKRPS